jgi:Oxygenase domain of the 2OGFeDO superfamily
MKIIKPFFLEDDFEEAAAKLEGEFADRSHAKRYIHKTRRIVAPDGETAAMFFRNVIPQALYEQAFATCWKHVRGMPSGRATAVGTVSMQRVKQDRTLSGQRRTSKHSLALLKEWGTATGVLGFSSEKRDMSRLTEHHLDMLDQNRALFELVDSIYREYLADIYAEQQAVIAQAPNRRLWDTVFSSAYLSKRWPTAYHRDGNLKGAMTALMTTGDFKGGDLVIPRWGIAFKLRPGDLLFFDAEELHGNLEIEGNRLSFAFYCASIRKLLKVGTD